MQIVLPIQCIVFILISDHRHCGNKYQKQGAYLGLSFGDIDIIQMTSLQKELNFFIYSTITDEQLVTNVKKDFTAQQTYPLVDKRWEMNLSDKKQQIMNAKRYYEGFKITQKSTDPEFTFKYLDLIISTYGLILNTGAFLVSLELLGDEEQVKHWREQVLGGKVMGAYGQTELGHGSNVKELETVAVYDKQTESFIINSPTGTSAKFWPGVLGQWCTHSVIQAKTIVEGKSIGVQTFAIELRDSQLKSLEGVELFDIGPKLGFERIDNGGVIFKNLKIPRRAMMMRYVKVSKDGKVEGLENTQAIKYGYGSMLNLRVKLTYNFSIRSIIQPAIDLYILLKEQGQAEKAANKKFITDLLCLGYGIIIANRNTHNIFNEFLKEIQNKNYKKADKHLMNCHIISSTFKAISSRMAVDVTSELITYNSFAKFKTSLFPFYLFNYVPSTTYEGDNTVLFQQTAKYLLFKFNLDKNITVSKTFRSDDWKAAAIALEYIVTEKLKKIKGRIESHGDKGVQFQTIWNELEQNALIEVSNIWGYMTLLQSIEIILPQIKNNPSFYRKMCQGFSSYIVNKLKDFQIYGFTIEGVQTWKLFTEQEYKAMLEINTPVERQPERMELLQREEKWLTAKL